jgi:murein DD-endopeptidase MepM/ murein hydrolase activator NlpD
MARTVQIFTKSLILFISLILGRSAPAFSGDGPNSKDTLPSARQNMSIISKPVNIYGAIEHMTNAQLLSIIDSLLDEDKIPYDLIIEIKLLVADRSRKTNETIGTHPAEQFYPSWNNNVVFSYKKDQQLKDSSILLILKDPNTNYIQPVTGKVTSNYGWRDSAQHNGIDIDLITGDKVVSAFDGEVRFARKEGTYGRVVIIRHYNGLETLYAHLSRIKVKPNELVKAGQLIGLGGNTGHSTGSHLHFEVRFKGVPLNPSYLISFKEGKLISDSLEIKKTNYGYAAFPYGCEFHTVVKGDNLHAIAKRYGTNTQHLSEINGLPKKTILRVGQKIRIS